MDQSRRQTLQSLAGLVGGLAVAGCIEQSTRGGDDGLDTDGSSTTTDTPAGPFGDWLADAVNADGTVADWRGRSAVRVRVGVDSEYGPFGFGPAAVHVDPGTTVRWEWTGEGGVHNVVASDGAFDSGDPVASAGVNFEHTVDRAGAYEYFCAPHKSVGMRGGVLVGDPPDVPTPTYHRDTQTPTETRHPTPTPVESPPPTPTPVDPEATSYGGYLENTDNFDGSVVDATGQSTVTVAVGAPGNQSNFAFDPPAVRVDSGTTLRWQWTGEGGGHSVVAEDGSFESDLVSTAGATFEHRFQRTGVSRYYCQPHKVEGMKGVVEVV